MHSDDNYGTYYPPRELAGHLPAYLSLVFVFVPILYMGLNMTVASPQIDHVDWIWDTVGVTSSEKSGVNINDTNTNNSDNVTEEEDVNGARIEGKGLISNNTYSVPTICDLDVRLINLRVRQRQTIIQSKSTRNAT